MRDALSLLDRLLSVGEKELSVEMIEQLLGLPKTQLIYDLGQALGEANAKETLVRADKMIASGLSPDTLVASLTDHLRNLLIMRTCGPDSTLVEVPGMAMKDLQGQALRFDPVVLSQDIAILEELRRQMRTSQAGRALLDATLVRLALAEQFNQIGDLLNRSDDGAASSPASSAALKKKSAEPLTPAAADDEDDLPAPGKVWENSGPSLVELLKQRNETDVESAPAESNIAPADLKDLPQVWQKLLDVLAARGPALHSLVAHGRLAAIEDGRAVIRYDKRHETFVKMLDRNGKKDVVRDALTQIVGESVGLKFEVDETQDAAVAVMEAPARPQVVRRSVEDAPQAVAAAVAPPTRSVRVTPKLVESLRNSEPLIKTLMDELGAQIVKVEPA
jgi:DNA polymerase-3 subunit gamma/tau